MPVTRSPQIAIPDIDRRDHDAGTGGRGPHHRLPTGGGGGDDERWDRSPQGRRGPRERLSRYRTGTFLVLAAILMFFIALASAYFVDQGSGHIDSVTGQWVSMWKPLVVPRILWLSTTLLLLASASLEMARRGIFHPTDTVEEWLGLGYLTGRRTLPWLLTGLLFGGGFLAGQYEAWRALQAQGVYYGISAHFFYLLTGAHAAHVIAGVGILLITLAATFRRARLENRQVLIDVTAWYWHGMSLVWLGLFAVIGLAR
ncbi:MAG: cytochrome c oxidase subunit 3 [Acidobacteriaceae bacterium]